MTQRKKDFKIHDFGILGKWSEDTLIAQRNKDQVDTIESIYYNKLREFVKVGELKVKKLRLYDLYIYLKFLEHKDRLEEDYNKYIETMRVLVTE